MNFSKTDISAMWWCMWSETCKVINEMDRYDVKMDCGWRWMINREKYCVLKKHYCIIIAAGKGMNLSKLIFFI
jgi:hypothetical protein